MCSLNAYYIMYCTLMFIFSDLGSVNIPPRSPVVDNENISNNDDVKDKKDNYNIRINSINDTW